ncbi:zinc-ribbon and DUF3426 domain-containing protein [Devosia sp. XJ19-1]|uniref:Zinc-ribbon and DUF3426 domain-containing protein n=1 Tax=Devosia ureilytica TaxID=2952754 RepID=A0A9Q4FSL3_9HYPH|nr:DUF3426 domain-containing protein [Devosia ureilytica]MCP8882642.1 zinc-ribbon and DUF3426 domain-containing protein [Devosia ureilytica]MCP8886990.1 zinc-ribbon and DUF3426 domain-containing protein [Devosia ureilytica]
MIITCPHCQTKYQVTYEVIGSVRRKVQCAHCHKDWDQDPTPPAPRPGTKTADIGDTGRADQLFDAMAEDALDEAMTAEASAVAAAGASQTRPLPNVDAAELQKRQVAFKRRQNAMSSSLPLARLRRAARFAGVVILIGLVGGAYFGRVPIVERYPDLAGLYEAVGLGVNVVGLDFTNLETLKALSGGNDVLTVSAQIVGKSAKPVGVPPVVISLLDASGHAVYEWSVTPRVRDLMAGERATFDTRLSLPPSEAVRVRLSFAGQGFNSGERSAGAANPADTSQPGMVEALAVPEETIHTAPAADNHDQAAEPDHAPAPAASEHH